MQGRQATADIQQNTANKPIKPLKTMSESSFGSDELTCASGDVCPCCYEGLPGAAERAKGKSQDDQKRALSIHLQQ
jgi:hypothetical protein